MKESLTKKQAARVEILKDALKWIKPSQVISGNVYFRLRGGQAGADSEAVCKLNTITDSKKLAKKFQKDKTCEVCAKGALFLSTVALHNEFNFGHIDGYYGVSTGEGTMVERMETFFTEEQLDLIEDAFETPYGFIPDPESYPPTRYKAALFGASYEKDIDRLRAILRNMIANKGTFKP